MDERPDPRASVAAVLEEYARGIRDFSRRDLHDLEFPPGVNLQGIDLRDSDLTGTKLKRAVLTGAILDRAELPKADLRYADLVNATMVEADLLEALLTGAKLDGAVLTQATLSQGEEGSRGAILDGCTGLSWDQLKSAIGGPRVARSLGIGVPTRIAYDVRMPNPKVVAVAHGRHMLSHSLLRQFLMTLGLKPHDFEEIKYRWPRVHQVLDSLFLDVQAVVVLLTGEEEVSLLPGLPGPREGAFGFQARPNVIFEFGMASAIRPDRVIPVQIGDHRSFSNMGDLQVVRLPTTLDGRDGREELFKRLKIADCDVNKDADWTRVSFEEALEDLVRLRAR